MVHEVPMITSAIFSKFQVLYAWQQGQLEWNKANYGRIRSYMGDVVKTCQDASKQARQAINLFVA